MAQKNFNQETVMASDEQKHNSPRQQWHGL
jgi:hypothetical protein